MLTQPQKELLAEILHDKKPIVCLHSINQELVNQLCAIIIEQEDELSELRS